MTYQDKFRRIAATVAIAATMTLGTGAALAQPMGGPHGPGPGAGDEMIGRMIAHAKAELNLNSSQQVMFDAAVTASKSAHESARATHQKVRDALKAELAKPEPNLAAVAAAADAAADEARALRKPIRDQWLQLYGTFSAEQKAVVRDHLQKRIARADSFREKMRERMQQHFGGKSG